MHAHLALQGVLKIWVRAGGGGRGGWVGGWMMVVEGRAWGVIVGGKERREGEVDNGLDAE